MRKFIFFVLVVAAAGIWFVNFARSGAFERYLDAHPRDQVNSRIEYYWGTLLDMAGRHRSASYRYRRVIEKYPAQEAAPLAWLSLIAIIEDEAGRAVTIEECNKFLEAYPDHPKAEIVRKKILFLQSI